MFSPWAAWTVMLLPMPGITGVRHYDQA
jgi:hypothetical protein